MTTTLPQKQHKKEDISSCIASNGKEYIDCTFYGRVSTKVQTEDGKSGFDRQLTKKEHCQKLNPHYKFVRHIQQAVSGTTSGRFEWLIEGLENGTIRRPHILFVGEMTRFSREPVQDVYETLIRFFKAGGRLVCP